jgi:hypothetical protein
VFALVAELHMEAFRRGLSLSLVWCPRETAELQRADALSKPSDPSDWQLSRHVVDALVRKHARGYEHLWPPTLDLFASSLARQCSMYVAPLWDGECVAVDALTLNWARVAVVHGCSCGPARVLERPVCYAFPPFGLLVSVLRKLALDGAVAWLVCPLHLTRLQQSLLDDLRPVCTFELTAPYNVLVRPTRAVPPEVIGQGWRTRLQMCLVGATG